MSAPLVGPFMLPRGGLFKYRASKAEKTRQTRPILQRNATKAKVAMALVKQALTLTRIKLALVFLFSATLSYNFWIGSSLSLFRRIRHGREYSIASLFSFSDHHRGFCALTADKEPLHLWAENLPTILAASKLSLDTAYSLRSVTTSVLDQVSSRLSRSVKALPQDDLSGLLTKIEQRYHYLRQTSKKRMGGSVRYVEPIKITILGGSVTAGVRCETGIPILRNQRCAWPTRLEQFINNIVRLYIDPMDSDLDDDPSRSLLKVHTLAAGGTNTATGHAILEFDVLPEEARNPDILINAYSTNDMHVLTFNEAATSNQTVRERVLEMNQDFIRTAKGCRDASPVVIVLDDYIGNEQREILKTQEFAQSIHVLANYYGIGFVSFADVVRDLVYADTHETMFSPTGWYTPPLPRMQREIHPGQGMHIATAWILAYNIFLSLTSHCQKQLIAQRLLKIDKTESKLPDGWAEQRLNGKTLEQHFLDARPRITQAVPSSLPPKLTKDLGLDNVSLQWQQESRVSSALSCGGKLCPFSWVSGIPWREESSIHALFRPIVSSSEWKVVDDTNGRGKFGWMPSSDAISSSNRPALVLEFSREHQADRLSSFTIFYVKSYGDKWASSEVSLSIERQLQQRWSDASKPITLFGFHNKTTSEMYSETIHFEPSTTRQLRVSLTLTGGSTFKVMGVAACRER